MPGTVYLFSKRAVDLAGSAFVLLLASPALLIAAVWIRISMGKPVLFRQKRPGFNEKPFWILKFRTMTEQRDAHGVLLPDEERLTAVGRFVRKCSLDEFPQFMNVLRGEMSLVGPRPLLMDYLSRYSPEQAKRHRVKPGITGWAQVNGRNAISWERKFEYDVWYVDHAGFLLDLKIFWMTLQRVISGSGVSSEGYATMPEFQPERDVNGISRC